MFLADMATFGEANKAYNPHMPPVNPPARACVQTGLPPDQPVLMDVLVLHNHPGTLLPLLAGQPNCLPLCPTLA